LLSLTFDHVTGRAYTYSTIMYPTKVTMKPGTDQVRTYCRPVVSPAHRFRITKDIKYVIKKATKPHE